MLPAPPSYGLSGYTQAQKNAMIAAMKSLAKELPKPDELPPLPGGGKVLDLAKLIATTVPDEAPVYNKENPFAVPPKKDEPPNYIKYVGIALIATAASVGVYYALKPTKKPTKKK